MSKQETKTKGMCIATRCTSVEQFIQMFHRFVDEESFFVSTLNTRPPGLETSFSVQLVDGTPVLRGLCVVMQAWTTPANPFKTPGVRLGIKRLTANSMAVFEQLLITRSAAKPALTTTQPRSLAAVVVAKPGTPKPIEKSPYTETAPARSAPSRVVLEQPARVASEPGAPRAASEPIPRHIPAEPTDVIEEKTDVREVKPLAPLAASPAVSPPAASPPAAAKPAPKPGLDIAKTLASIGKPPVEPAKPIDKPTVAKPPVAAPLVGVVPKPPVATQPLGVVTKPPVATPPLGVKSTAAVAQADTVKSFERPAAGVQPAADAKPIDSPAIDLDKPAVDIDKPIAKPALDIDKRVGRPAVDSKPFDKPAATSEDAEPESPPIRPSSPVDMAKPLVTAEPVHDDSRTPGSDFVLPANPLMNLTDESLVGYVDCTLYEETGNFFPAEDDTTFGDDVAAPPTAEAASRETPMPLDQPPAAGERIPSTRFESNAETEVGPRRDSAPALHTPPPPGSPAVTRGSVPSLAGGAAKQTDDEPPSIEIVGVPATAAASPVLAPRLQKRQRLMLLGGVGGAAAALVVVLVVVMTSSSDGGTRNPAAQPAKQAAANVVTPPVEQLKTGDAVDPTDDVPEEDIPPPTDGAPVVGSGPCKFGVHTTPAGSIIKLDGNSVGPSPLTVAAPCGKHKVEVSHARYAPQTRQVTLTEGKTEDLEVTLSRPTHVVTVTSTPPGAQIFINGRSAGTTPMKLSVLGFVTLKLELKKTGYQPAEEKFYSRYAQDKLSVRLTKW